MRIAALISALTLLLSGAAWAEMEKPASSDPVAEDTTSDATMDDTDASSDKPAEAPKVKSSDPHPDE